jgi:chromosome partitioning protein
MPALKTIALYNVKGGVGKSAAAVNLAYLSSSTSYSTLLWDLDSQGASYYCLHKKGIDLNLKDFVKGEKNVNTIATLLGFKYTNAVAICEVIPGVLGKQE